MSVTSQISTIYDPKEGKKEERERKGEGGREGGRKRKREGEMKGKRPVMVYLSCSCSFLHFSKDVKYIHLTFK